VGLSINGDIMENPISMNYLEIPPFLDTPYIHIYIYNHIHTYIYIQYIHIYICNSLGAILKGLLWASSVLRANMTYLSTVQTDVNFTVNGIYNAIVMMCDIMEIE
jgi:hypothetical protein